MTHAVQVRGSARPEQESFVENQTGGRVRFFLGTDDFWRDYCTMSDPGVGFVRPPLVTSYGTVAIFKGLYGDLWDLVKPSAPRPGVTTPLQSRRVQPGAHAGNAA